MKKTAIYFFLIWIAALSSCKKLTEFRFKESSTFTVPKTSPLGIQVPVFDTTTIASSASFQFQNNGTDASHVKDIKLDEMKLTITNPSGQTFSFLNSIHINIYADGLPEVEIAYLDNIPPTIGNSIQLTTTGAKLDEYIKKDSYSLRIKTVTDEQLYEDVTIRADMILFVRAKLL